MYGKSKEQFLEEQQIAANRSNPEFQNYIKMLKEQPTPAIALQQSSMNTFNEAMDSEKIPPHIQALLRGLMTTYGDAIKVEYQDKINELMASNRVNYTDHSMMVSRNAENIVS